MLFFFFYHKHDNDKKQCKSRLSKAFLSSSICPVESDVRSAELILFASPEARAGRGTIASQQSSTVDIPQWESQWTVVKRAPLALNLILVPRFSVILAF